MSSLAGFGLPILTVYKLEKAKGDSASDTLAKNANIQRDIEYFSENVGKVNSVDDLFGDYKLMSFVLHAVDLGTEIQFSGRAKRALSERMDDPDALMNRLSDKRFKNAARVLELGETGVATLKKPETIAELKDLYVKMRYDDDLRRSTPEVSYAKYFEKNAGGIENYFDILGDAQFREVVTKALGLPKELAYQDIDAQAAAIERRLSLDDLKKPEFVEKLTQRFLIMADQERQQQGFGAQSYLLNLFV
ncbi:DUF1217 domain-containing protein [Arenibaculum sp.]|jgi:hypothetical protein|uniref:DUF1217 domain-containing protein n=1 Tax=Arenibaculum sp. TaxID=2865862 RepID=UPI002E138AFD|nr:DUF1217 domain-containing protein [Arenibaculum sp.]